MPATPTIDQPLTVRVGGLSRDEVRTALARAGVLTNHAAETLIEHAAFTDRRVRTVQIVTRTAGELVTDGPRRCRGSFRQR